MINIKLQSKFDGYSNFRDITNSPASKLAAGSLNVFINDGEKIEPRAGMDYLGVAGTQGTLTTTSVIIFFTVTSGVFVTGEGITGGTSGATGIIGNANNDTLNLNNYAQLLIVAKIGTFVISETITGGASGATGVITVILTSDQYWTIPNRIHSQYFKFINKEGINVPIRVYYSGDISKGDIIEVWLDDPLNAGVKKWYKINLSTPLNPLISSHRYYFAPWWDSVNLQSRVNFSFGAKGYNPSYNTNWEGSWTGGIAKVIAVTATTITTDKPWVAKGFLVGSEGINGIRANGIGYTVTSTFDTDTVTVVSTAGINVGDYVFQAINIDQMPGGGTTTGSVHSFGISNFTTADVISTINNQIYYEDWTQRNVYISHNRNITPSNSVVLTYNTLVGTFALGEIVTGGTSGAIATVSAKFSNTLVFNVVNGTFTIGETITGATSLATAIVGAVSVPTIANSLFTIFSGLGLDDLYITPFGTYTGSINQIFKIVIDGSSFLNFNGSGLNDISFSGSSTNTARATYNVMIDGSQLTYNTLVGVFVVGEVVTGGTSGATATIKTNGAGTMTVTSNSGTFIAGETITGLTSGATANVLTAKDTFSWSLNNGAYTTGVVMTGSAQTLSNGISVKFAAITGHTIYELWQYVVDFNAGDQDTYAFYLNGSLKSAHNKITLTATLLSNNIYATFGDLTGHQINDFWESLAETLVIRGYRDFTYSTPNRLPGEGFTLTLDSNGWTMYPQENAMLINDQAGQDYVVTLTLSADLKSETVSIQRLKSDSMNKTLFPYLINSMKNQLARISLEKTFDSIGRQKFLELPQTKSISDEVRIDFETADWEDGDILYFKRKIYFNLPKMGVIFVYDDYKKYWHAPMQFGKRISLLSIIDDKLIGHSYEQNESYELFTGLNDLGIFPIKTRIVFPYESFGQRMAEKQMTAIGFEGYMLGIPEINYTINAGLGGCEGQYTGTIAPQNTPLGICVPKDRASLGKSGLGFHGLGNDPSTIPPHFYYVKPFDNMIFYMRNIELACDSLDQRWSIISLGTDVQMSNINNESITDRLPT